jgi:hypothetical protein
MTKFIAAIVVWGLWSDVLRLILFGGTASGLWTNIISFDLSQLAAVLLGVLYGWAERRLAGYEPQFKAA